MIIEITKPKRFCPTFDLPSSKSISNRALILNWLCEGKEENLTNVAYCDDTEVLRTALRQLSDRENAVSPNETLTIDVHGAGTAMRFLTALVSILPGTCILTGNERMQERPIGILVGALRSLGAHIEYLGREGFPPLKITGQPLSGGEVTLSGCESSQYISALMMIGPLLKNGLTLQLRDEIASKPYIDMTMQMMKEFGAEAAWSEKNVIRVEAGNYKSSFFTIESDWSAASYWYEIAYLRKHMRQKIVLFLKGLKEPAKSLQGDSIIAKIMEKFGITSMHSPRRLKPGIYVMFTSIKDPLFTWDFSSCPDLVPAVAVTCALTNTEFEFYGVKNLRIKETDRLAALQKELEKLGIYTSMPNEDTWIWKGMLKQPKGEIAYLKPKPGTVIQTYNDHRMALAFAPACIVLGSIRIEHPEVVNKSYPGYWKDLEICKFEITETRE